MTEDFKAKLEEVAALDVPLKDAAALLDLTTTEIKAQFEAHGIEPLRQKAARLVDEGLVHDAEELAGQTGLDLERAKRIFAYRTKSKALDPVEVVLPSKRLLMQLYVVRDLPLDQVLESLGTDKRGLNAALQAYDLPVRPEEEAARRLWRTKLMI